MSGQPEGAPTERSLLWRLWPYARPDLPLLLAALVATPLTMLLALAQPWLLKRAIDEHITPGQLDGLQQIALMYLVTVVFSYLLGGLYAMSMSIAGQRMILRLRLAIFEHLVGLAPAFFDNRPAGELLTRATSDVEALGETMSSGVITIVLDVLMIVGVLSVMFWLDWRLTLLLFAAAPPLLLIIELSRRRLRVYYLRVRESLAALNAYLAERITGLEILQLYGHEEPTRLRFRELNKPYTAAAIRSNVFDALMFAAVDGVGSICVALMLFYSTGGGFGGAFTAGLMVAFIEYLQLLFRPLRELSQKIAVIQRASAALEKIWGLMDEQRVIGEGDHALDTVRGHVQMQDLRFSYRQGDDADDIIKGVDLEVLPGQVVAIVGPTGCGKTTLTRLIARAYDGYRGSLKLDGVEVSDLKLHDVRRAIAAVSQDIQLFPDTVRFNVGLGDPLITDEQLHQAAELVHAREFIEQLPGGWDTPLAERGGNLSVGQGQLLTFARTMAHNPELVILDEATASVDPVTERLIQDAIARILERKTVIVIAHRLSTIQAADRIVVMSKGQIVESGTHDELLQVGGHYAELVEAGLAAEA